MAEYAPTKLRARLITIVYAGYSIHGILVALTGMQLIQEHGWQTVFFLAITPIALIPFILKTMPESLPALLKKGRTDEVRKIIGKILPEKTLTGNEEFVVPQEDRATSAPVAHLFTDGRAFSTLMIWTAFLMGLFMVYSLSTWLTKLMALAGYSLGSALNFVLIFNIGAVCGAIGGGWLGDKYNIKYVLVIFYLIGALSLTLMGFTHSTELLFVVVFVVGASTLGTQLLAYAYAGEYYPTSIPATGVGFASGVGRLGAILAPVIIGFVVAMKLPLEQNFMVIGAAGAFGTLAVMLINHRLCASTHHYDAVKEATA